MSRPSSMVQRPLTLTEELDKLEQSITLTLQEIDHNFSQAHRIVTTSILPLVEQYSENSRDVWDGAKFWKQFFESSANVSLSGYEEKFNNEDTTAHDEEGQTSATTEGAENEETDNTQTNQTVSGTYDDTNPDGDDADNTLDYADVSQNKQPDDDLDMSSLTLGHNTSTPRVKQSDNENADNTELGYPSPSPYETLKKEVNESQSPFETDPHLPQTPTTGKSFRQYRGSTPMSPGSSPFVPPVSHEKSSTSKGGYGYSHHSKPSDPVLHRMPDKAYRVQATPLGKSYEAGRSKFMVTPKARPASNYPFDDSPLSSPEPEAPKLHEEIFSPIKRTYDTPWTDRTRAPPSNLLRTPPAPGTSVLTPAKGGRSAGKRPAWDSDDDDDMNLVGGGGGGYRYGGLDDDDEFSPPKTMQFHIPQSRLMKTPAKEASKKIVDDLLVTAGADDNTESVGEQSPSLIRRAQGLEDETL